MRSAIRLVLFAALLAAVPALPLAGAGGHSEEGGEGASHELAWKWANFALLAGGLGYLFYKKGGSFFRSRTEAIRKDIEEAHRLRRQAEEKAALMEQRLANLQAEVEAIRRQAEQEMAVEGERLREEREAGLEKIRRNAEMELDGAIKAARQQVRAYAAELAAGLAASKLRAAMDDAADDGLVTSFLNEMESSRGRTSRELN